MSERVKRACVIFSLFKNHTNAVLSALKQAGSFAPVIDSNHPKTTTSCEHTLSFSTRNEGPDGL